MARYSNERKAALLKKLLPPINLSVAELARQENISEVTKPKPEELLCQGTTN